MFDKLKKIEFAGNNESKTIVGEIRTVLTSNFHDFKNPQQIKSSVVQIQQSLNTNNTNNTDNLPHIIRGGCKRHAVYFVVQKGDNDTFKITICNRCLGYENHLKIEDKNKHDSRSAPKEIEIELLKLEEVLDIISNACSTDYANGAKLIYEDLINSGTVIDSKLGTAKKIQRVGNCDIVGLKQALGAVCEILDSNIGREFSGREFYKNYLGRKKLELIDVDLLEIEVYYTLSLMLFILSWNG